MEEVFGKAFLVFFVLMLALGLGVEFGLGIPVFDRLAALFM